MPTAPQTPCFSPVLPAACPFCHEVGALPCPVVYERGTSTGIAQGPYSHVQVVVHSSLARQAAPPPAVTPRRIVYAVAGVVLLTAACLWPLVSLVLRRGSSVQTAGTVIIACLLLAPLGGALLGSILGRSLGFSKLEKEYQARLDLWRRTWLCPACHQTWLP